MARLFATRAAFGLLLLSVAASGAQAETLTPSSAAPKAARLVKAAKMVAVPQAAPASEASQPATIEPMFDLPLNAMAPIARPVEPAALAVVARDPAVLVPEPVASAVATRAEPSAKTTPLDGLIARYADVYQVPVVLVRRVVKRESNFRPGARNGPYWGLMQIRHDTAKGMGYRGGASGLLDAETNLKYAVKYLRGAFITAGGNHDQAVRLYARGYYYDAKRKGLLVETGLRPGKAKRGSDVADVADKKRSLPGILTRSTGGTAAYAGATPRSSQAAPAFGFMQGR